MSDIPSWVRVGQKVVCVDAAPRKYLAVGLTEGAIYTIRGTNVAPNGVPGVLLVEVQSSIVWRDGRESSYHVDRFRPLVTIEDDLKAHFSALLHVPASKETERA